MTIFRAAVVVLVAVLAVLTLASFAWAACAWVLWTEQPMGSNQWSLSTSLTFTFDTKKECEKSASAALDARIREVEAQEKQFGKRLDEPKFFACFPDTVDPRGAKGAGR